MECDASDDSVKSDISDEPRGIKIQTFARAIKRHFFHCRTGEGTLIQTLVRQQKKCEPSGGTFIQPLV
eukprot:1275168-Karenia_brevis.AAC.1